MNRQADLSRRPEVQAFSRRPARRRGTVLLIVAIIVMLLSLAAYQFMLTMQTEHLAAAITGDRIQAQQAAYSARDLLTMMLESSRSDRDSMGGLEDNPLYFGGDATALSAGMDGTSSLGSGGLSASFGSASSSAGASITGTESGFGSGGEAASLIAPQIAFGTIAYAIPTSTDGRGSTTFANQSSSSYSASATSTSGGITGQTLGPPTRYGAKNESAKLHLLKLLEWEQANEGSGVAALMNLPGMDTGTAESIMDWLDEDDEPRANGAESEFYSMLTRPLIPRNALPPDLDELLFVRGVDTWRLFGLRNDSALQTAQVGSSVSPLTSQSSFGAGPFETTGAGYSQNSSLQGVNSGAGRSPFRPWAEFLTVYAAERNETYTGAPRLFINGKKLQDLHQQLLEILPLETANFLILYRQFGPTKSEADEESETTTQLDANQSADSITISFETDAKFVIANPLDLIGITVTVPAPEDADDEKPLVLPSPFGNDAKDIAPQFVELLDKITIIPDQRLVGRINVNEAAPEILMTLPNMTETIVESIMTDRAAQTRNRDREREPSGERKHPIWLLTEGIVEMDMMRQIWSHVTCGGDVYRAEVWGYVDERSPTVRFETVLDASLKNCRPVYYRELSAPKNTIQIKAPKELIAAASGNERSSPRRDSRAGERFTREAR